MRALATSPVAIVAVLALYVGLVDAQETDEEAATAVSADWFTLPEADDADQLLSFIERISQPQEQFQSRDEMRQYMQEAAGAIENASERILAGEPTDIQAVDAVEWKVEALRVRRSLGDADADQATEDFLDSLAADPRPAVAKAVARSRFAGALTDWRQLSEQAKTTATDGFVASVKEHGASWQDVMVARNFSMVADMGGGELAAAALRELIPVFRTAEEDRRIRRMLPEVEGIARLLNLLGNQIELEGSLLNGEKLDWESYRGKVVLVDFWATWCGPCRAEVPNLLANYNAYHDKGFEILGISLDDTPQDAQSYVDEMNIPWPTVFSDDPNATGWNAPMAIRYAINAIPRAILVDQEGIVVDMNARGRLLGKRLQNLLGDPVEPSGDAQAAKSAVRDASR